MKFVNEVNEKVWDPVKQKIVAEFENGVCETEDPELIELLKARGYQCGVPVIPSTTADGFPEPPKTEPPKVTGKKKGKSK